MTPTRVSQWCGGYHSTKILGANPARGLAVCSLHVLCRYSNFHRQFKDVHKVRLISDSKLTVDVNGCLFSCINPVTDW